jgi:hypothetical protein
MLWIPPPIIAAPWIHVFRTFGLPRERVAA